METFIRRRVWFRIVFAVCLVAGGAVRGGYSVSDLGLLPGGHESSANSINLFGQIAGSALQSDFTSRAIQGGGTSINIIGTLGGLNNRGFAINNAGRVAGDSQVILPGGRVATHAFKTDEMGLPQDMGVFGTDLGSTARSLSSSGQFAGAGFRDDGTTHAILGSGPGSYVDLGTLGGRNSFALGLNDAGIATGWAEISPTSGIRHAFRSGPTGMVDLGTLPGSASSVGQGVNAHGDVVGYSGEPGSSRAFLAPRSGGMIDIGLLPFSRSAAAFGINDLGLVVGQSDYASGPSHAFIWDPATSIMYDLNDLITASIPLTITNAYAINNGASIAGTAIIDGRLHGVVLNPVPGGPYTPPLPPTIPEPSSWILLGIGGALAMASRRFRRGRTVDRGAV